jgi:molecular chaperone GrpE (heat shock protein)
LSPTNPGPEDATAPEKGPSPTEPEASQQASIGEGSLGAQAYLQRLRLAEDQTTAVLTAIAELKQGKGGQEERISGEIELRYHQRRDRVLVASLGVLDKLDQAIAVAHETGTVESLVDGLRLVRTLLHRAIKEEGLEHVSVLGLPVDNEVCIVVGTRPVDRPAHHKLVVEEVQRAHRIDGRLARAAKVIVGVYTEPAAAVAEPEPIAPALEATPAADVTPSVAPAPAGRPPAAAPVPAAEAAVVEGPLSAEAASIAAAPEATGFAIVETPQPTAEPAAPRSLPLVEEPTTSAPAPTEGPALEPTPAAAAEAVPPGPEAVPPGPEAVPPGPEAAPAEPAPMITAVPEATGFAIVEAPSPATDAAETESLAPVEEPAETAPASAETPTLEAPPAAAAGAVPPVPEAAPVEPATMIAAAPEATGFAIVEAPSPAAEPAAPESLPPVEEPTATAPAPAEATLETPPTAAAEIAPPALDVEFDEPAAPAAQAETIVAAAEATGFAIVETPQAEAPPVATTLGTTPPVPPAETSVAALEVTGFALVEAPQPEKPLVETPPEAAFPPAVAPTPVTPRRGTRSFVALVGTLALLAGTSVVLWTRRPGPTPKPGVDQAAAAVTLSRQPALPTGAPSAAPGLAPKAAPAPTAAPTLAPASAAPSAPSGRPTPEARPTPQARATPTPVEKSSPPPLKPPVDAAPKAPPPAAQAAALMAQADDALVARRYDAAVELYDQAIKADPQSQGASAGKARAVLARDLARRSFVTGQTIIETAESRKSLSGFDTSEVDLKKAPKESGKIDFEIGPKSPHPGDPYTVRVFLTNLGKKTLKIGRLVVTTSANGTKAPSAATPRASEVEPGKRVLIHESSAEWADGTTAWSVEAVVTTPKDETLRCQANWR